MAIDKWIYASDRTLHRQRHALSALGARARRVAFVIVIMAESASRATEQERNCDEFYREVMRLLNKDGVPYLLGGAYAFGVYTGIQRDTKDFDLFVRPKDFDAVVSALKRGGYETERTFPHWLGKAKRGKHCIDFIYRAGNGLCEVGQSWFDRARDGEVLGMPVKMCAPEEIIWMKAFIMERERFDGADVAHLLERCAESLDWNHLLARFADDAPVLLSHLLLFGYIYPSEQSRIPHHVTSTLLERVRQRPMASAKICRGTLLSRAQYLLDVQERGYRDARLEKRSHMTPEDIEIWTEAIKIDGPAGG
jgi:predicted nucleotidyltransferase